LIERSKRLRLPRPADETTKGDDDIMSDKANGERVDIDRIMAADTEDEAQPGIGVEHLAKWARGEGEYVTSEVVAAIDRMALAEVEDIASRVGRIETRKDALAFLVDWGVVTPEEARTDL
jgi:hypothetical protein